MVLRRLSGKTENTAPVLTLITQFGGGKTHTLTALYHLARSGEKAAGFTGRARPAAGSRALRRSRPRRWPSSSETPGTHRRGARIRGSTSPASSRATRASRRSARRRSTTPPGTEAIGRVFEAAGGPVLLLFDEVLNFLNRHRGMAESFHAFIQNLTVATTGTTHGAAVISLPRSQVEMTEWDQEWQDRISKVVRRVAKDLIANDETEISEVVRRRLFQDLGSEKIRKNVAKAFGDWCFERRERSCHPSGRPSIRPRPRPRRGSFCRGASRRAIRSTPRRSRSSSASGRPCRSTSRRAAPWRCWRSGSRSPRRTGYRKARTEPLITLGSAPLAEPGFRSVVLGQLGESRLVAAIDADIAGEQAHARALDADTKGPLRDIHRRVGTAILFESSGGQTDKVAHLPELRFALGEPEVDTTSIDNAAFALEDRSYFIRKVGLRRVPDRLPADDEEGRERPARVARRGDGGQARAAEACRGGVPARARAFRSCPSRGRDGDSGHAAAHARCGRSGGGMVGRRTRLRAQIAEWTRQRGKSPRLYPGALVWCLKKPGRDLREKVEVSLAWKRVAREVAEGTLGGEFDKNDRADLQSKVKDAEEAAKDEVWGDYRFAVVADGQEADGLKVIDLGAGHSSSGETLCGRVIAALKSEALLNESVGAGYIERNWPPALKDAGAWPLASLRQSFLNGSLTRLVDPDAILKSKIVEFVGRRRLWPGVGREDRRKLRAAVVPGARRRRTRWPLRRACSC